MPTTQVGMQTLNTFRFTKDPALSNEQNLKIITDFMKSVLKDDGMKFEVTMNLIDVPIVSAEEAMKFVTDGLERHEALENLEVVGLDREGDPLYKAKK